MREPIFVARDINDRFRVCPGRGALVDSSPPDSRPAVCFVNDRA
jgi:hypothetical protein